MCRSPLRLRLEQRVRWLAAAHGSCINRTSWEFLEQHTQRKKLTLKVLQRESWSMRKIIKYGDYEVNRCSKFQSAEARKQRIPLRVEVIFSITFHSFACNIWSLRSSGRIHLKTRLYSQEENGTCQFYLIRCYNGNLLMGGETDTYFEFRFACVHVYKLVDLSQIKL